MSSRRSNFWATCMTFMIPGATPFKEWYSSSHQLQVLDAPENTPRNSRLAGCLQLRIDMSVSVAFCERARSAHYALVILCGHQLGSDTRALGLHRGATVRVGMDRHGWAETPRRGRRGDGSGASC